MHCPAGILGGAASLVGVTSATCQGGRSWSGVGVPDRGSDSTRAGVGPAWSDIVPAPNRRTRAIPSRRPHAGQARYKCPICLVLSLPAGRTRDRQGQIVCSCHRVPSRRPPAACRLTVTLGTRPPPIVEESGGLGIRADPAVIVAPRAPNGAEGPFTTPPRPAVAACVERLWFYRWSVVVVVSHDVTFAMLCLRSAASARYFPACRGCPW